MNNIQEIRNEIKNSLSIVERFHKELSQFVEDELPTIDTRLLTVLYDNKYYLTLRMNNEKELYFDYSKLTDILKQLMKDGVDEITAAASVIFLNNTQLFEKHTGFKPETITYIKFGD